MACIHHGRTRAHVDRHAQRLEHFVTGGSPVDSSFSMESDAIVAPDGDTDRERYQLLGFAVQGFGAKGRLNVVESPFITSGDPPRSSRSDLETSSVNLIQSVYIAVSSPENSWQVGGCGANG